MKPGILLGIILLLLIPPAPKAAAQNYIELSGVVQSSSVDPYGRTTVQLRLAGPFPETRTIIVYGDSSYSMRAPANALVEIQVT